MPDDSPLTMPPRSILGVEPCRGECGTGDCATVVIACDCAAVTHLLIDLKGETRPGATGEAAFTCDGCMSVHWFVVKT